VAQFLVKVFNAPLDIGDPKGTAYGGIRLFKAWIKSIGMPTTLEELGVPKGDLNAAIERCVKSCNGKIGGYMDFDAKAIAEIYTTMATP
jgi:alcohol dehydrogenase YqhD (iron-dependent ADH family)